jgi:acetolactate decarboxylase
MKYVLPLLLAFWTISCTNTTDESKVFKVEYNGALKNIMMQGDLSAQADLRDLKDTKHLYALGALENLKGEILILDGQPFMTSAEGPELSISHSFDYKASLLVYAAVPAWKTFTIPENILSYQELEKWIAQTAKELGIDTDQPFPFLLEGKAASVDWHSVNWPKGDTEHSHEKHIQSGPHGNLNDQELEILGFYSNSHHAIFTHHTTNMHLHLKTKDEKIVGHVDGLNLGVNMILKLPVD